MNLGNRNVFLKSWHGQRPWMPLFWFESWTLESQSTPKTTTEKNIYKSMTEIHYRSSKQACFYYCLSFFFLIRLCHRTSYTVQLQQKTRREQETKALTGPTQVLVLEESVSHQNQWTLDYIYATSMTNIKIKKKFVSLLRLYKV